MTDPDRKAWLARHFGAAEAAMPLFEEALTHGSMGAARDYQRLEFLGDRVLGLVVAEALLARFPDEPEGKLSQRLNRLVARETCADVARAIDLGPVIRLGKQARDDGGADSTNILGDVVEALIGAQFTIGGLDAARACILALWGDRLGSDGSTKHPKSALQEWAAGNRRAPPAYTVIDRSGPDHAARFTVAVSIRNVGEAQADGSSKQEAETAAAAAFLARFG